MTRAIILSNSRLHAGISPNSDIEDLYYTNIGGLARYPDDAYLRFSPNLIGNPWILTTLYLSMYRADAGELEKADKLLEWATARASSTHLLPEQVNAYDESPIGVLPFAWSHAALILAVKKLISRSAAERVA